MSLLIASVVMGGLAGLAAIYPILARRAALTRDVTSGALLDAEARKRVALVELKEIEYDYLGGKIDDADYQSLREKISREALTAIRAADAVRQDEEQGGVAVRDERRVTGGVEVVAARDEHACGFANPEGSRFCAGCGARLV